MSLRNQIILHLLILAAIFALFEFTDIDVRLQDKLYAGKPDTWIVDRGWTIPYVLCYSGIKSAIIAGGIACGALFLASLAVRRLAPYRRQLLMMTLSIIVVPGVLVGLREVTNVYGPYQLERYGKDRPYVKVFDSCPPEARKMSRGKCFPAGHATGGFALMMLYFVFRRRVWKWTGLAVGLTAGWTMGGYQILTGKHFLSHTLVTMSASWILILVVCYVLSRVWPETTTPEPRA